MRIDPSSVSPVIPNQPADTVDPKLPEAGADRQPVPVAEDPAGAAATEFSVRRAENDLHTLAIKAKIGAAGASTVPGAPVVLSSRTEAAAGVKRGATGGVHETSPASASARKGAAPAPDPNAGAKNAHPDAGKPGAPEHRAAGQAAPKPPAKQAVNEKIREVMEWEKKGLVEGGTTRFKARLRSKDPKIQAEAQKEFEQFKRDIRSGRKADVEDCHGSRRLEGPPGETRISDANKAELQESEWLKGEEPDLVRRREFMDWLEKNHKAGEFGPEIPEGAKVQDGHVHIKPGSKDAKQMLNRWREEEGGFRRKPALEQGPERGNGPRPEERADPEAPAEPKQAQAEPGRIKGAEAVSEETAEAMGRGGAKAMGEAAAEALPEAAVKGLVASGGRAFLSALGELGLPMLDAILAGAAGISAMEEGKERLKQRSTAEGFSAGLAAGLLGESPDWVREKLGFHSAAPQITDHVAGTEGIAEQSFNDGLAAGFKFARSLTPDQKKQLLGAAFKSLAAQGYRVSEKDFSGEANVRKIGAALNPIIQAMVEKARQEEDTRAKAARPVHEYIGHNI